MEKERSSVEVILAQNQEKSWKSVVGPSKNTGTGTSISFRTSEDMPQEPNSNIKDRFHLKISDFISDEIQATSVIPSRPVIPSTPIRILKIKLSSCILSYQARNDTDTGTGTGIKNEDIRNNKGQKKHEKYHQSKLRPIDSKSEPDQKSSESDQRFHESDQIFSESDQRSSDSDRNYSNSSHRYYESSHRYLKKSSRKYSKSN